MVVCGSLLNFHCHRISSLIKQGKWRSDVWRKRWIIEQLKRLISEQVKARRIREQVKARWMLHSFDQWASEGAMHVTCVWSVSKWRRDACYMRLIWEQLKERWISEQVKARCMLHAFDLGAIKEAMDATCIGSGSN